MVVKNFFYLNYFNMGQSRPLFVYFNIKIQIKMKKSKA